VCVKTSDNVTDGKKQKKPKSGKNKSGSIVKSDSMVKSKGMPGTEDPDLPVSEEQSDFPVSEEQKVPE